MLLQTADDVAQRAFACFRRGCARIATGHLPGGAHAVVVVGNDRDVHGAAAARGRAQFRQNQVLELRLRLRRLVGLCLRRLVGHGPLLQRAAATFERERILLRSPRIDAAHAVRSPPPQGRAEQTERADCTELRTWAAAPDEARLPAFSAWGSSLRAAPVSSPP